MRRACVLRQLGRCAVSKSLSPKSWSFNAAPTCSGLARQELRKCARVDGAFGTKARSFTTLPALRTPWKISRSTPPSEHPHPHSDTRFDALPGPEQFRSVMRLLPNSVVVCTSTGAESVPRGMTMSSFTSLCLHPTPLITFNIATPSRTLDAITLRREFIIHILSGDIDGARVADWFRWGNSSDLGVFEEGNMREGCGCEVIQGQAETAAPLLRGNGVLYGLKCKLVDEAPHQGLVRVRDHVVVLAEVADIVEGRGEPDGQGVFGLAYADRKYRQLGGTIVHDES